MNFLDARYVRIYVQDTPTWLGLQWEGQCFFMLLLRRCDRAGVVEPLDFSKPEAMQELADLIGLPVEITEVGFQRALKRGCIRIIPTGLFVPRYQAAQDYGQNNRARQEESRASRRDLAAAAAKGLPVVPRPSKPVTNCDDPSRTDPPDPSRTVTPGHSTIPDVTPYRSELNKGAGEAVEPSAYVARESLLRFRDKSADHVGVKRFTFGGKASSEPSSREIELWRACLYRHRVTWAEIDLMAVAVARGDWWGHADTLPLSTLAQVPTKHKADHFGDLLAFVRTPSRPPARLDPDSPLSWSNRKRAKNSRSKAPTARKEAPSQAGKASAPARPRKTPARAPAAPASPAPPPATDSRQGDLLSWRKPDATPPTEGI